MILSDADVRRLLEDGDLAIEPMDDPAVQVQPASVDLRLGDTFYEFEPSPEVRFDPQSGADVREHAREVTVDPGDSYDLRPGAFALGTTAERVDLPDDLVGVLIGRSSFGRLGVVPYTGAGFVDPGFAGELTLAFSNNGPFTVVLHPGSMRVVQLYLVALTSASERPYGRRADSKYQDQAGPAQSQLAEDWSDGPTD